MACNEEIRVAFCFYLDWDIMGKLVWDLVVLVSLFSTIAEVFPGDLTERNMSNFYVKLALSETLPTSIVSWSACTVVLLSLGLCSAEYSSKSDWEMCSIRSS